MNKKINIFLLSVLISVFLFLSSCVTTPDSTYTVTFDSQGGSMVSSQSLEAGQLVSEPAEPSREDYSFEGWYQEPDCINLWDFSSDIVTSDLTLYAKWTSLLARYVSMTGDNINDGSVDHPWKTIQYALDNTPDNGTVYVADGIYKEHRIKFPKDRVIVLKSKNGAGSTTIDGENIQQVIEMDSCPEGTTLDGFTITGGNIIKEGGGISVFNCSPTISNNIITGNQTQEPGGGGVYLFYSSPVIQDNTFSGNTAVKSNEPSSGQGGAIYMQYSSPTLINNNFTSNKADKYGGALYLYYSSPTIENNVLSGNTSDLMGGGIYMDHSSPDIHENTISGNSAGLYYNGGGIYLYESSPSIENNMISGNTADEGGAIYMSYSSPTIHNNTIEGNSAIDFAGGIYISDFSSPSISFNTISSNAVDDYGGGIYIYYYSSPTIEGNNISGNTADDGGGMYISSDCSPFIYDNTITGNTVNRTGGGICDYGSSSTIQANTITENICSDSGGGIFVFTSSTSTIGGTDASNTENFNTICGNTPDQVEPNNYPNNHINSMCD
jgi:uncharacterized repeat protein (TIGR02543 family)